jgi:hypothetical protein
VATKLEDLVVRISADSAQLRRELSRSGREVEGFTRKSSRGFTDLGGSIRAAAGALAAFGVATQLRAAAQASLALADSLKNTSDRVGTTAEALQRLRAATEPAGIASGKLDSALLRLSKNMGEAQQGSGALVKALAGTHDELLESLTGANNAAEGFLRLADGIAKIESPTERARVAQAALGRSGVELVAVLAQGRESLEATGDAAADLGAIISDETVTALDDFGDALEQLYRVALAQFTEGIATAATGADSLTSIIGDPETIKSIGDMAREIGTLAGQVASLASDLWEAGEAVADFLNRAARIAGLDIGIEQPEGGRGATGTWGEAQVPATDFGPPRPPVAPVRRAPRARSSSRAGGSGRRGSNNVEPDLSQLDTSNLLRAPLNDLEAFNRAAIESIDALIKTTSESVDEALAQTEARAESFGDFVGGVIGNFVNGAETDWKRLATSFIAQLVEMQVAAAASELFKIGSRSVAGASAKAGGSGGFGGFLASILGAFGFAEGGIVTKPTLAVIGEGIEAEGVFPLSQLRNFVGSAAPTINVINKGTPIDVESVSQRRTDAGYAIDITVRDSVRRNNARGELRSVLGQRHAPGVG